MKTGKSGGHGGGSPLTHHVSSHGTAPSSSAKRLYRSEDGKWVTRDIAALDFLHSIPLEAERSIVQAGLQLKVADSRERSGSDDGDVRFVVFFGN